MNKSGQENRSVRNTKRRLREGLLRLLEEKPINEISVKELAELVDVNRGTFYFHYQDIYDLLRDMEQDFFENFDRMLSGNAPTLGEDGFPLLDAEGAPYLHAIFSFIDDNRSFCRIMLSPHGDMQFVELVKERIDRQCRFFWQLLARPHRADPRVGQRPPRSDRREHQRADGHADFSQRRTVYCLSGHRRVRPRRLADNLRPDFVVFS